MVLRVRGGFGMIVWCGHCPATNIARVSEDLNRRLMVGRVDHCPVTKSACVSDDLNRCLMIGGVLKVGIWKIGAVGCCCWYSEVGCLDGL